MFIFSLATIIFSAFSISSIYMYYLGKDTWAEVWGDGIRFNSISNYCDDGNLNSDDGWSTSCQVDYGWYWSGGNQSTKDTCVQLGDQSECFTYQN